MKNQLWVEKYRPKSVDEYVFVDDRLRQQVKQWIKDESIPHLLSIALLVAFVYRLRKHIHLLCSDDIFLPKVDFSFFLSTK